VGFVLLGKLKSRTTELERCLELELVMVGQLGEKGRRLQRRADLT